MIAEKTPIKSATTMEIPKCFTPDAYRRHQVKNQKQRKYLIIFSHI
jgi:hypothetical protein